MKQSNTVNNLLTYGFMAIIVLLPFHAVFTTALGSNFGHLDFFRIWKELLIAILVPLAAWQVYRDPPLWSWIKSNRLVAMVMGYVLLHLILGLVALLNHSVSLSAVIYALLINLRFLIFGVLVMIVSGRRPLKSRWRQWLLWPAALVIAFGLMQQFVLPPDFLRHVGYGPETIPAIQTIDQKSDYRRLQSTLRGANPLGAYLALVLTATTGLLLTVGSLKRKAVLGVLLAAGTCLLFFTYSRSAWLGTFISLFLLLAWMIRRTRFRRIFTLCVILGVIVSGCAVLAYRDNDRLQNIFFHSDESSRSAESSNAARLRSLQGGVQGAVHDLWGQGPGTAGPASVRNQNPPRIAENYYVQIMQEVGIVGLLLFIMINLRIGILLWRQRKDVFSAALLASLIGITFINLLSHAWTDDTLSLIWWGLAGLALAPHLLQSGVPDTGILKRNNHEKIKKEAAHSANPSH